MKICWKRAKSRQGKQGRKVYFFSSKFSLSVLFFCILDSRPARGAGSGYPKQMVVILHPELQVFHDISDRLDKVQTSLIFNKNDYMYFFFYKYFLDENFKYYWQKSPLKWKGQVGSLAFPPREWNISVTGECKGRVGGWV